MRTNDMGANGFTLIEGMIVLALTGLLVTALVPYFFTMRNTWGAIDQKTELLQHGRVAMDKISSELRQAKKINSITASNDSNGRVVYLDSDGVETELLITTISGQSMLAYVQGGVTSPLAGPITMFQLDGRRDDTVTSTTVPAQVRSIHFKINFTDPTNTVPDQLFDGAVHIRKDFISALYYMVYASDDIWFFGNGTVNGDVHANDNYINLFISVNGTVTEASDGVSIPTPVVNISTYLSQYTGYAGYQASADVVATSNFTFQSGNTYTGLYYIANGASATFQTQTVLNGTVVAEGDVVIGGNQVTVNPSGTMPAIISGQNIQSANNANSDVNINGTMYAVQDIDLEGNAFSVTASPGHDLAMGAGDDILFSGDDLVSQGAMVATDWVIIGTGMDTMVVTPVTGNAEAILAGDSILLTGDTATITGIMFAQNDIDFFADDSIISGVVMANDDVRVFNTLNLTYNPAMLFSPPAPHLVGE